MTKCGACHGSGMKFDVTCYGNVNTHADTIAPCRACKGTGIDSVPAGRTFEEIWQDSEPAGELPAWMTE